MGHGAPGSSQWPFVGRTEEFTAIDAARRGRIRSTVIAGPSGVGKTRLARAVADAAAADAWDVEWAIGTEAARAVPLGAFLHLVPDGPPARGEALLGAIVDELVTRSPDTATLLVVDDAHLLDPASATLVHRLALTDRSFVVCTLRSGEQLVDALRLLWRDDDALRIELTAFDKAGTTSLAEALLGGEADPATRQLLWEATRGNALHVRELVREGRRREALTFDDSRWRWHGPLVASAGLAELVDANLAQLPDEARAALEIVAVSEPMGLAMLQQIVPGPAIDSLEAEHMIEIAVDGQRRNVRCAHPLHGEVLRAALGSSRADEIRVRFADALDRTGGRRNDDALRLVRLRLDAGAAVDPELLLRVARQSRVIGYPELLERVALALRRHGPSVEAEFLFGQAAADAGDFATALERWAPLEDRECDDEMRALVAKARASVLANVFERTEEALRVLDVACARVESGDVRAVMEGLRANIAVDWDAEQVPDPAGAANDEAAVWMWIANPRIHIMAGRFDDVADDPLPVEDFAYRSRGAWPLALTFVGILRFFGFLGSGRFDAALALTRAELERAGDADRFFSRSAWTEGLGLVALERGNANEAAAHLADALAALAGNDNGQKRNLLSELAYARAQAGDLDGAGAALAELETCNTSVVEPYVTEVRARVSLLAAEGRTSAAAEALAVHADALEADNQLLFELYARLDAARYGRPRTHAARLRVIADAMQGPLPPAFARFAEALAADDTEALTDASRALEQAGCLGLAAEAAAAAARRARRDARADAFALNDRARLLAHAAGRPRTPLLAGGEQTVRLTMREREIAVLAARGTSDRDIATSLGLSVRTVNAHLRTTYMKLGIGGRRDLAGMFAED